MIIRTLPRTWRLLRKYGAVLYEGHNRIGLGTFPNLMALLAGENTDQLQDLEGEFYVDEHQDFTFIPKIYRDHDYLIFQMEDCQDMGHWVPGRLGFKNPPADFYYRAWDLALADARELRCGLIGSFGQVYQYLQEKSLHEYQLDVLHDFIKEYNDTPTFAFLHLAEYTHNDQNLARLYDDHLASILGNIEDIENKF